MKILHVVPSYKPAYVYGGPIESVARLCEALAGAGHEVEVFTTTANGKSELDVIAGRANIVEGVQVTYFTRLTKDPTHVSPALWKRLLSDCQKYDAVHIHSWWNILVVVAALICHRKKVKVVISPRGMLSDYIINNSKSSAKKIFHSWVGRRQLAKAHLHATSDGEYKECVELLPGWHGTVIPNLLTLPDRKLEKSANTVFTLLFLSRIHPKKGLELIFQAISTLPFKLVLRIAGIGEAEYITGLKALVGRLGIEEMVEWVGWKSREEKFDELANSDLLVLTSFNENFANVVIESIYMGTPVLISDMVGLASFVREENLGWVTSLDVAEIRDSLERAFREKEKRVVIGTTGRQKIDEIFAESKLTRRYVQMYESL
jgi:glycosyltransferase involved in cell wall biosynthesis